jgi:ribosome-associated protein
MQPAIRDYYRLEEIWGDKEIKLGAAKRISKRTASEDASAAPRKTSRHLAASQAIDDEPKKPARKTSTRTATTKTAAVKKAAKVPVGKKVKVAPTKTATSAKKAPAKRAPARTKATKTAE